MLNDYEKRKLAGVSFATFSLLLGMLLVLFFSSSTPAAPTVTWTLSSINETVFAGAEKTLTASFTASENLKNLFVRVVPELQRYVAVSPSTLPSVTSGQTINLTIKISAPLSSMARLLEGTIQIRDKNNISKPLPVAISIVLPSPEVSSDGVLVSFAYPLGWAITRESPSRETVYNPASTAAVDSNDVVTPADITISLLDNPAGLSVDTFLGFYRDGWYAGYQQVIPTSIHGHPAIVVDDSADTIRQSPSFAALIVVSNKILLITAEENALQQYDDIISSLQLP